MGLVKSPVTLPAGTVPGTNGRLSADKLTTVAMPGLGAVKLERNTARAWHALAFLVEADTKRKLTTTSGGAYRTFAQQLQVFNTRMVGVLGIALARIPYVTRRYESKTWYLKRGFAPCAAPEWWNPVARRYEGGSNHGWGIAIDAAIWDQERGVPLGITTSSVVWKSFVARAVECGFTWEGDLPADPNWQPGQPAPKTFEPWHIRHVRGADVAQVVKDLEAFFGAAA